MKQISKLTGRHIRLYMRDGGTVLFSLLSMIIVIMLMVVFLGNMNVEEVVELLEEMNVADLEQGSINAEKLILMWTIAGVISVNAVMIAMSISGSLVQDKSSHRLQSFYVSPVSRVQLAVSYVCAAWIGTMAVCLMTLLLGEVFAVFNGVEWLSFAAHGKLLGMIVVCSFVYSAIMYLIAQFVDSMGAWSGFGTVIGTLVGFLGAIYLPMGMLPEGVQTILKCMPFLHGASMFRNVFTESLLADTFAGLPAEVMAEYSEVMGITVSFGDKAVLTAYQVACLVVCGMIVLILSGVVMKKRSMLNS